MAAFALAALLCFCMPSAAYADDASIKLKGSDTVEGTPFSVSNMFPGDSVTNEYTVKISHVNAITLHYHADIRSGYEILAEVLKVKVTLPDKGIELYDGLMRDMPASLDHVMAAGENELKYSITVYLDTSVGNITELDPDGKRYMRQKLIADFRWWYLEEEEPGPGPDPENPAPVFVKLGAEKTLNGKHPRGHSYTFLLRDGHGNLLQTQNNNGGWVEFDSLGFHSAGEYLFYVTEQAGTSSHIKYDGSEYKAIVTVTAHNGSYIASVRYEKNDRQYEGTPVFKNISDFPLAGDNTPLLLYGVLFITALALLLLLLFKKRKRKEKYDE